MIRCIKINSVSSTATEFLLETAITNATIYNGQKVRFCIHTNIPASTTVVPVFIVINGVNIPLMDALGNTLQSDQIKNCFCYNAIFGTEPLHLKLCTMTNRSQATATSVVPDTTAALGYSEEEDIDDE